MSETISNNGAAALDELRRHKVMFDHTWTLTTALACAVAVLCWYFGLAQVDVGPVIWILASLSLVQLALSSQTHRATSRGGLQQLAFSSQLLGTVLMGVGWHLFGGLQQPLFPLFIVLPLLPGALLLGFWQQQVATLALVLLLASGVLLSPDTNSFIEERYGISLVSSQLLPGWMPRSRVAFADVSTSPTYDLMLMMTVGVIGIATSTTASALVSLCRRSTERVTALESELARLQELTTQLVTHAPCAQALVVSSSGRIISASERFRQAFDLTDTPGPFLLDAIAFAYPGVIKRMMTAGGEEIQGATVRGRDVVVRVRAGVMGAGASQVAALNIESCDEICWRGAVDALDEPVFTVNAHGRLVFLNRSALMVFGEGAEGAEATQLFDTGAARWWDIAPLESARRILDRGGRRYLASIRRERVAASISELSFVHLHERGPVHAVAAS